MALNVSAKNWHILISLLFVFGFCGGLLFVVVFVVVKETWLSLVIRQGLILLPRDALHGSRQKCTIILQGRDQWIFGNNNTISHKMYSLTEQLL